MPVTYPLDLSGNSPDNLIQNELHSVSESRIRDYYFIVPNFSPFYVDNFRVTLTDNGNIIPLTVDVDYSLILPYIAGTRATGKPMYGGITLHNLNLNGILSITYQTVGGEVVADRLYVLNLLAERAYNPRTTVWDTITNVPDSFPPTPHYQDYDNFYGQEEVVTKLGEIRDAIITNSSLTAEQLTAFLEALSLSNPEQFFKRTGGDVTGPLNLLYTPTRGVEAVNMDWVTEYANSRSEIVSLSSNYYNQNESDSLLDLKLDKAGGTITGYLVLSNTPAQPDHATTKLYVDTADQNLQNQIDSIRSTLDVVNSNYATKDDLIALRDEIVTYFQTKL